MVMDGPIGSGIRLTVLDDPDHKRLRSLVRSSLTARAVEAWRPRIRDVVSRVLAGIDGGEFDLIAAFAGPVPTVVIAEMLGIDPAMHGAFKRRSDTSVRVAFNPFPAEAEGERLSVSLASANRDPAVYPDPNAFDIERVDVHHHAFGGGRHHRHGARLARVEAQEAILGLLRKFSRPELSPRGSAYGQVPSFRGLRYCWVRAT